MLKKFKTIVQRDQLVTVEYIRRVKIPSARSGDVGDVRSMPRAVAYRMAKKGQVKIISERRKG